MTVWGAGPWVHVECLGGFAWAQWVNAGSCGPQQLQSGANGPKPVSFVMAPNPVMGHNTTTFAGSQFKFGD